MRLVLPCLVLFAIAGCASQEPLVGAGTAPVIVAAASDDLTPKSQLHCHKESPAGSNMIRTVCEADQTEAERQALQNKMLDNGAQNRVNFKGIGN